MPKRCVFLSAIFIFSLLFSSCSSDQGGLSDITEELRQCNSKSYVAEITASFPSREAKFKINYTYNKSAPDKALILSPEEIADTRFAITEDSGTIEFDGTRLELGELGNSGVSPFRTMPLLISSWLSGEFSEVSSSSIGKTPCFLAISRTDEEDDSLELRTWFTKETHSPLYAEIFCNNERIIQCVFERTE